MPQWEYHHEPPYPTVNRLNELGRDGWEYAGLVELTDQSTSYRRTRLGLLFKRPALTVESMFESVTAAGKRDVPVDQALR